MFYILKAVKNTQSKNYSSAGKKYHANDGGNIDSEEWTETTTTTTARLWKDIQIDFTAAIAAVENAYEEVSKISWVLKRDPSLEFDLNQSGASLNPFFAKVGLPAINVNECNVFEVDLSEYFTEDGSDFSITYLLSGYTDRRGDFVVSWAIPCLCHTEYASYNDTWRMMFQVSFDKKGRLDSPHKWEPQNTIGDTFPLFKAMNQLLSSTDTADNTPFKGLF